MVETSRPSAFPLSGVVKISSVGRFGLCCTPASVLSQPPFQTPRGLSVTRKSVPLALLYSSVSNLASLSAFAFLAKVSLCACHAATGSLSALTRTVARIASHSLATARAFVSPGNTFCAHSGDGTAAMVHW